MKQFENLKMSDEGKATSHVFQATSYLTGDTQLAACCLQLAASQFPIVLVFRLSQHQ
jgi:hypothetical protein